MLSQGCRLPLEQAVGQQYTLRFVQHCYCTFLHLSSCVSSFGQVQSTHPESARQHFLTHATFSSMKVPWPCPALPPSLPHALLQYLCFKIIIISIYLCTDTVPSSYLTDVCAWLRDGSPPFTAFSVCTDSLTDISPQAEQSAALIRSWLGFKVKNELWQDHSCC